MCFSIQAENRFSVARFQAALRSVGRGKRVGRDHLPDVADAGVAHSHWARHGQPRGIGALLDRHDAAELLDDSIEHTAPNG